ncbi:MAG: Fis family transcriptional regulator [Chloracidobacterium sp. CP2_5A]|nr:MAG: Fis family transcriptional regulator [Chloracidobacterium sp. CP2_5A]
MTDHVPTILIVDDELSMRELLDHVFRRAGYRTFIAENGAQALEALRGTVFDIVLSDVKMPRLSGTELLLECRKLSPDTVVILMTAHGTVEQAREAFKLGADDFIQKPFDIDELKLVVKNAFEKSLLRREVALLKRELGDRTRLENIIGRSRAMQEVLQLMQTIAGTNSTVLITGESGTGKELVARGIHACSPRSERPFVSINCGAFTETLLESELFGYIKGAFTGAIANKKGLFEAADGGTLFLDEIGEMSLGMQVKLLRALQERSIRRVGGTEEIPVDVRVVAATNRDLSQMVEDGSFRKDLYFRVNVIPITVPPLRERREDIRDLALHFLKKYGQNRTPPVTGIAEATLKQLESYSFPGNVRELENIIERAVALEPTPEIQPERLPESVLRYDPARAASAFDLPEQGIHLENFLMEVEKSYILQSLRRTRGNQTKAAELLNMSVRSLRHLLDKHKIRQTASIFRESGAYRAGDASDAP